MTAVSLTILVLCASFGVLRNGVQAAPPHGAIPHAARTYSPLERAYVAKQLAGGATTVPIWIATEEGRATEMGRRLAGAGGSVLMIEHDIDFVVASVPIANLVDIAAWPDIAAVQIDIDRDDLLHASMDDADSSDDGAGAARAAKPGAAPGPYTPRNNPYTGESATQSFQFKAAHGTYDGRGVVIGGIEPLDPRTPSLADALSLKGERIPKLANYVMLPPLKVNVSAIPPEQAKYSFGWQQTQSVRIDAHGRLDFNAQAYTAPAQASAGEMRISLFRTHREGALSELTLLWSVESGRVWICRKGDTDFNKGLMVWTLPDSPVQKAMAALEPDDPEHQLMHTILIAVDREAKTIGAQIGGSTHGSMCASVATGQHFLNGEAEGVAPGAQFSPVNLYRDRDFFEEDRSTRIRSLLALIHDARVDLLTISGGTPLNGRRRVPTAASAYSLVVHRLVQRYGKAIFWAAGNNGPSLEFEDGPINGSDVIAVGGYTPRETWEANFGIDPSNPQTLMPYSALGPSYDGALKPDLLGLTGTLCAAPLDSTDSLLTPYFERPPGGYGISGGTSAAAPNAAGHAALLISAAKQAGIPYDVPRLRMALFSTAKFLDGIEARAQGHGLIQVADAWDALQKLKNYTPPAFTTQAPVKTAYSHLFETPDVGQGLYERSGWTPGQAGDRQITISRTNGSASPVRYLLRWHGDVSTFTSSEQTLTVPLNTPVALPIHIKVGGSRAYSAIVDLVDPTVGLSVHSVLLTVIVGEPLTAANGYTASVKRTAPRPGHGFVFVDVPEGTSALRVQLHQDGGKAIVLRAQMPNGLVPRVSMPHLWSGGLQFDPWTAWYLLPSDREDFDQTFEHPVPGVWQFWVTRDRGSSPILYDPDESRPARAVPFTLTASAIGVTSTPTPSLEITDGPATVTFTNTMARLEHAEVKPLGLESVREDEPLLTSRLTPTFYDVDVEPGTSTLEMHVDLIDAPEGANVSLFVFRVSRDQDKPVETIAADIHGGAHKQFRLDHIASGKYKIALDLWGTPLASPVRAHYRDALRHPMYGDVFVDATTGDLERGQSRVAHVTIKKEAEPVNGRTVVAEVGLFCKGCGDMKNSPSSWTRQGLSLQATSFDVEPVAVARRDLRVSPMRSPQER